MEKFYVVKETIEADKAVQCLTTVSELRLFPAMSDVWYKLAPKHFQARHPF